MAWRRLSSRHRRWPNLAAIGLLVGMPFGPEVCQAHARLGELVAVTTPTGERGPGTRASDSLTPLAARRDLLNRFPGVGIRRESRSPVLLIYGKPMTVGGTPRGAVERWMAAHAAVLGVDRRDLWHRSGATLGKGGRTIFSFRQTMDSLPVENAFARLLVRHGSPSRVVYVGARLARPPPRPLPPDRVSARQALETLWALPHYATLVGWSDPRRVMLTEIIRGSLVATARAWKVHATGIRSGNHEAYTFFVDASTGELLEVRDEIYRLDVRGRITGFATPGTDPDTSDHPPVEIAIPGAHVFSPTGTSTFTNDNGTFRVSIGLTDFAILEVDLVGEWVRVRNGAGSDLHLTVGVPDLSQQLELQLNTERTELTTAQMNAFLHVTRAHDFYADRQPDYNGLDLSLKCVVNLGGGSACSALFDSVDLSIRFTRSTELCPNTAYTSVVTHEYGHFIVNRLGFSIPQGSFGEGFSDSLSVLIHDDPAVGRGFNGPGTSVRDIVAADRQFPCAGQVHSCGQVLAGTWWDTKLALQASLGDQAGLAQVGQLFTDWSRITMGGRGDNSAHPDTAVEMLVADDDDGDLSTLTPHYREICSGLAAHNIPCPIADCNGNGFADSWDILTGASDDCTANGTPDECERDCNANGRADSCDLADGLLADDDGNTVPDICQAVLSVPSVGYPTIGSAIDAALPGDTILVAAGTYTGNENKNLDFDGKILNLQCETPGECVIDCQESGRGFYFHRREKGTSIVDGFTIINGSPEGNLRDGGAILCFSSDPTIRNCRLLGNSTTGVGGGLACLFANPTVHDCLIAGNSARKSGGGIAVSHASPNIHGCTITDNHALSGFGIRVAGESLPVVRNCIVWSDRRGVDSDIFISSGGAALTYTVVRGGWPGAGNMDVDPLFVDPDAGDYNLAPSSRLINRGDPADSGSAGRDVAGHPRVQGCRIDIGALESSVPQLFGDFNADGRKDLRDIGFLQRCFDAAVGNPAWRAACACVFDADGNDRVSSSDLPAFLDALTGP